MITIKISVIGDEEGHLRRVTICTDDNEPAVYEFKFVGNAISFVRGIQVVLELTGQDFKITQSMPT
jgi:hypothetical protein